MIDFTSLSKLRNDLIECIKLNDLKRLESILSVQQEVDSTTKKFNNTSSSLINLNFVHRDGQTPLHHSCMNGNLSMVKLLVEFGSSQSIKNRDGWYPIHLATYFGHLDIVKYLFDEKNFKKESLIAVFDDETNRHANVYRSNDLENDESDDDDETDSSDSEDSDYGYEDENVSETTKEHCIHNHSANETGLFNLDDLKNLDLNENLLDTLLTASNLTTELKVLNNLNFSF